MDIEARKRIVERHLTGVRWEGEVGFAECPGVLEHTHPNQPRDCKIYVAGTTVTVHCFHESCAELITSLNRLIRSELAGLPGELTKAERREYARTAEDISLEAQKVSKGLEKIYAAYWRGPELLARALTSPQESQAYFWGLFADTDILWVGDVHHSGFINGPGHFRSVAHWKTVPRYWEYTATGIFNSEGNVWRAKRMVIRQPYLVIEFDHLDPDPLTNQLKSCAIYFYLAETFGLEGKIAILSGKKSVHFWVRNTPLFDDNFLLFLKNLGADSALFRAYQPVRFPGVIRADTNKPQSLIIL
jgi:hypothetical protein